MGLEDDARRIAKEQGDAARAAKAVKRAAAQHLASMHPWNISVDGGAQALLGEFVRSATRMVHPLPFMVFRGAPRPSGDKRYSKGDRTGLEGWCLFATQTKFGEHAVSSLVARNPVLGVTSEGRPVCVTGLTEKGTYTNTGFMGPRVVICLSPGPYNPYHDRGILGADTPISGSHTIFHPGGGHGPGAYDPHVDYSDQPLRGLLAYNLAAMMHNTHPQQTESWKF